MGPSNSGQGAGVSLCGGVADVEAEPDRHQPSLIDSLKHRTEWKAVTVRMCRTVHFRKDRVRHRCKKK